MEPLAERWGCTTTEYHAFPAVSQSALKVYLADPQLYLLQQNGGHRRHETPSMRFGTDVERLAFYGKFPSECPTDEHKRLKWMQRVFPLVQACYQIKRHDRANKLIHGTNQKHVNLRWVDEATALPCKCQIDVIYGAKGSPSIIVDLKTAASVSARQFNQSVLKFGYDIQASWYREAVRLWCGKTLPFVFVVVENRPSYKVEVYDMDEEWLEIGARKIAVGMQRLRESIDTNNWDAPEYGRVKKLSPPRYAWRDVENLERGESQ